jgi:predicted permease
MTLLQDLRFAVRLLRKDWWFTLVAVVTLALGIAANSVVFTLVNAVLVRGLPFYEADRIVGLGTRTRDSRNRNLGVSVLDFGDWRAARSFSDMSLIAQPTYNVSEEGRVPERFSGAVVSSNLFRLIGERALIGRTLQPEDDAPNAPAVVLIGYGMWQSRYAGDPSVLGRTIKVNELQATIVGVMPNGMKFPPNSDLWLPLGTSVVARSQGRQARNYMVLGRLIDGATIEQAQAELSAIAANLAKIYPETNKDVVPTVESYLDRTNAGPLSLVFWSLMGAVVFVLLIACANVANLLLARAAQRSKEIAVRVSIGATRWRLVRQLLVESVLVAVVAGIVSLPLAVLGIRLFDSATQDVGKPYFMEFTMDVSVFTFFAMVCLTTGIVFGLAPALHVSKTKVNDVLKESGRANTGTSHARRWMSGLLVFELALTLVLLAGAGFMMRSFLALYRLNLGIDTSRLLTMQLVLPERKYKSSDEKNAFIRRMDERLAAIGAIEAATTATNWPLGGGAVRKFEVEGAPMPQTPPQVTMLAVGPRYMTTLGLPVTRGRPFREDDATAGREGAIVNQRLVDLHFAGVSPIGRRIRLTEEASEGANAAAFTVIGVVPNVRQRDMAEIQDDPIVYIPYLGSRGPGESTALIVRGQSDPARMTSLIREELRMLDPDLPLFNIRPLDENLARQRWPFRVFGAMFAIFALIALVLSVVGIYAITAYSVTQRTQEIGVRMALGAQSRDVVALILRRTSLYVFVGLTIGLAGAFGVGQLLQRLLIQTSTRDPVTLGSIAFLMLVSSVTACIIPARRAAELDPLIALRYE